VEDLGVFSVLAFSSLPMYAFDDVRSELLSMAPPPAPGPRFAERARAPTCRLPAHTPTLLQQRAATSPWLPWPRMDGDETRWKIRLFISLPLLVNHLQFNHPNSDLSSSFCVRFALSCFTQ
jgi:hypothetical protein